MKTHPANPVIIYKQQGVPQPTECDNLSDNDFLLGLQTPLQRQVLQIFGHRKAICIDTTFGTNSYDFILTTVLMNLEKDFLWHGAFPTVRTSSY